MNLPRALVPKLPLNAELKKPPDRVPTEQREANVFVLGILDKADVSRIRGVKEQKLMNDGLLELQERLRIGVSPEDLLRFPMRKSGAPLLLHQPFFERLFRDGCELEECLADDVA